MHDSIIYTVILVIIFFQILSAYTTQKKIKAFKRILEGKISTQIIYFSANDIKTIDRSNIDTLKKIDPDYYKDGIQSTLIQANSPNPQLKTILDSINIYLIKNKGAVSDFNLIKDIVDRNLDSSDEEISNAIPVPLYLGLIGTMIGIIVGLFFMPSLSSFNEIDTSGVDTLLSGVKVAMIASAIGLVLTTVLSNWSYKGAKKEVEEKKNNFYTWLQSELLPVLSQNETSGFVALQRSLGTFNTDFKGNLNNFNGILKNVEKTFDKQLHMIELLESIDMVGLAKSNLKTFQKFAEASEKIEDFSHLITQMTDFIENTNTLNDTISNQLRTIGDIKSVVTTLGQNAQQLVEWQKSLNTSLATIDTREQAFQNKLTKFDVAFQKQLDDLQVNFAQRLNAMSKIDTDISQEFKDTFGKLRQVTEKVFQDEFQKKNIVEVHKKVDHLDKKLAKITELIDKSNTLMLANHSNTPVFLEENKNNWMESKVFRYLVLSFLTSGSITFIYILYTILFTL